MLHVYFVITSKMTFSKATDYIEHPLFIAKIDSYGVSPLSTIIIFSYLINCTKCTKIKNSFSKTSNILHGVPQLSIFEPLLFNIDLFDLFCEYEDSDISSYADDTTPYLCGRHSVSRSSTADYCQ